MGSPDPWRWILLDLNRWVVAAALLAVVYCALLVAGALDPVPLRAAVVASDPVETLFQALLTATVTGVTLVVTINQLVLSQELGAVGDQRERMAGATAFRREVESVVDASTAPAEPGAFLAALVDAAGARADDLAATTDDAATARFAADLRAAAAETSGRLADARFGTFAVVAAALTFDYSRWLHDARRLRSATTDPATEEALAALVDVLELYAPAREHIKTLYFQWALIDLSRAVLYAAVPALAVAASAILVLDDAGTVTGATLGVDNLLWVVGGATVVTLLPFALFVAYVLRIVTVAKRTLAVGPFVLRDDSG